MSAVDDKPTVRAEDQKLRLDPSPYEREARQYAERVYRTLVALEPLYAPFEAISWLNHGQVALGNERPAALLQTHGGTTRVQEAIAVILTGAFS